METVTEKFVDYLGCDPGDITAESTLESLKIDSLDMVEIIMNLEEEFSITIDGVADLKTVGELVTLIEETMKHAENAD